MGALLEIRNLQLNFGAAEAVRGINLHLAEGEVLGSSESRDRAKV